MDIIVINPQTKDKMAYGKSKTPKKGLEAQILTRSDPNFLLGLPRRAHFICHKMNGYSFLSYLNNFFMKKPFECIFIYLRIIYF